MSDPLIGRVLGDRYRVDEYLDSGNMGDVYRGWEVRLSRSVAIKVIISRQDGNQEARRSFEGEARKLAKIQHGNVAAIYDFQPEGDPGYIVMEYVSGVTLNERAKAGPIAESEVIRLGVMLAEGMKAAHDVGIVHSDLKPANVRVTDSGTLKILDFGIARFEKSNPDATKTHDPRMVSGTLAYMAPEQMRGGDPDARSDLYSAGALLYEVAVGQRPFTDKGTDALMFKVQTVAPPKPRELNRAISRELEAVLIKCLEKDPQDRFPSAEDLKQALQSIRPRSARPTPVPPEPMAPGTIAKIVKIAGIAAALLAVVGLGAWQGPAFVRGFQDSMARRDSTAKQEKIAKRIEGARRDSIAKEEETTRQQATAQQEGTARKLEAARQDSLARAQKAADALAAASGQDNGRTRGAPPQGNVAGNPSRVTAQPANTAGNPGRGTTPPGNAQSSPPPGNPDNAPPTAAQQQEIARQELERQQALERQRNAATAASGSDSGTVDIRVEPFAAVYVNGSIVRSQVSSLRVRVPAGHATEIKAVHPTLGQKKWTVTVARGEAKSLDPFNFVTENGVSITVRAGDPGGEIVLNDRPQGKYTPTKITGLPPGHYVVRLRLKDPKGWAVVPERKEFDIEGGQSQVVDFTIQKR